MEKVSFKLRPLGLTNQIIYDSDFKQFEFEQQCPIQIFDQIWPFSIKLNYFWLISTLFWSKSNFLIKFWQILIKFVVTIENRAPDSFRIFNWNPKQIPKFSKSKPKSIQSPKLRDCYLTSSIAFMLKGLKMLLISPPGLEDLGEAFLTIDLLKKK